MEIRTDINSLQLNPNSKTDAISALLNILRLLDVQGVSGDAALIMGEQLIKLEESKLEHGK